MFITLILFIIVVTHGKFSRHEKVHRKSIFMSLK